MIGRAFEGCHYDLQFLEQARNLSKYRAALGTGIYYLGCLFAVNGEIKSVLWEKSRSKSSLLTLAATGTSLIK